MRVQETVEQTVLYALRNHLAMWENAPAYTPTGSEHRLLKIENLKVAIKVVKERKVFS